MTIDEQITLLNDAENALLRRKVTTTDVAEKDVLTAEIDKVRRMRDLVNLRGLLDTAATLNQLAGVIEKATGALKTRPFDAVLGAYQSLLDRIGAAIGQPLRLARAAVAVADEPTAAPSRPRATAREAAVATARETSAAAALAKQFERCNIRAERLNEIDRFYIPPMTAGRATYQQVADRLGMPWWVVGVIHGLEGSFSFETHLHNGDPLTARTVKEPAGHPKAGQPPFTWLESAIDALTLENMGGLADWSIGPTLDRLEAYNGLGYRNRGVPSPYLWSFSNQYEKGKFVADHKFDPEKVSDQCGAAVIIKRLIEKGLIDLSRPLDPAAGSVATVRAAIEPMGASTGEFNVPSFVRTTVKNELNFPGIIKRGQQDTGKQLKVRRVQEWCSFHGHITALDGDFSGGTETAVREFQIAQGFEPTGVVDERCWAALTAPMHQALGPIEVKQGDTIYDVVLRVARQHLAVHPIEFVVKGEGNCGPWVRLYMLGDEGTSQLWCAGFVSHVIGQAAFAMEREVPIPRQVGVDDLVKDAKKSGRFIEGATLTTGEQRIDKLRQGCLFVVRKSANDWVHVGFATEIGADHFKSLEGNSNEQGSPEGFEVCARARGYDNRDFILLL